MDFAAEMEAVAQAQLDSTYEAVHGHPRPQQHNGAAPAVAASYDAVYFDSDEDEVDDAQQSEPSAGTPTAAAAGDAAERQPVQAKPAKANRKKLTDDELLYDPAMDDEDEQWLHEQRTKYLPTDLKMQAMDNFNSSRSGAKAKNYTSGMQRLPDSDAILNCPACLTAVCVDCQRHERYPHQYRAMFVMNVQINKTQVFQFKEKEEKLSRRQLRRQQHKQRGRMEEGEEADDEDDDDNGEEEEEEEAEGNDAGTGRLNPVEPSPTPATAATAPEDQFHPAYCTECGTLVAMYDIDEVYHFFNVIDGDA